MVKWMPSVILTYSNIFAFLPSALHSMICMWQGNFDTSTWFFPVKVVVPFDTSTVFGWYMKFFIYTTAVDVYFFAISSTVIYLASCCLYIEAGCKHFQLILKDIDENAGSGKINKKIFHRNRLKDQIRTGISFHIELIE